MDEFGMGSSTENSGFKVCGRPSGVQRAASHVVRDEFEGEPPPPCIDARPADRPVSPCQHDPPPLPLCAAHSQPLGHGLRAWRVLRGISSSSGGAAVLGGAGVRHRWALPAPVSQTTLPRAVNTPLPLLGATGLPGVGYWVCGTRAVSMLPTLSFSALN